ncbi:GNAT superfamily N-acetyltransferase [Actinoplanes octamycinicus]|uniref:GNAT superfamily N-acetyltransferase n=1 Tax=Actinoplanes octamycinicus TaxID=135948 RepID=A0A7W7MAE8_9ACTN|nr:GNAT family N-acetyltransferase [Actinoplanes octamycinicus]MBB4742969.1 GNAT superfamily N-acetyltransferase [Actinoplanes octamycinicus]
MDIRECVAEDVERLERWRPTGRTRGHAARFARQAAGAGSFLIAWSAEGPLGSCELLWTGPKEPAVRAAFACPEINGLQVWPPHHQGRGVGTALLAEAERRARHRGLPLIGLGVADDNPRAAALYLRLGYTMTECRYVDHWHYLDDAGARHDEADPCIWLVKKLPAG